MSRFLKILIGLVCLATPSPAQGPDPASSPDFKILVSAYGLAKEPVNTEELVGIGGRIYQFASNTIEVVMIEPGNARVVLLDIKRRVQSEVSYAQLEEGLTKVKTTLTQTIERLGKTGNRADEVEAGMTRHLIDPRLAITFDPRTNRVRLTNPTVEVTGDGEPDANLPRLTLIAHALAAIAKLGAFRTPNDLPPFIELDALATLFRDHQLRPTELVYLYRLTGPARKFRRTYRLISGITDRDREAIRRIDELRGSAPVLRYEKYRTDR